MTSRRSEPINIVGGGLAGALLALLLARRGMRVVVYERGPDPRVTPLEGGRSINLALAARGLRALEAAGLGERVRTLLVAMRGRMVHEPGLDPVLQPYGQRAHEVIWSVSRAALNLELITAAAAHPGIELRFSQHCLGARPVMRSLHMHDQLSAHAYEITLTTTIAADGAGSAVRQSLVAGGHAQAREDLLDHAYKELEIPAGACAAGLERNALHIWPRGGFMLIALPNTDGSFTATLFLQRDGAHPSFATLACDASVEAFFRSEFPGTLRHLPDVARQFAQHPLGLLGTVHCSNWHFGGDLLLLGDAAHAIVPFHGQGMNCAFEDCLELAALIDQGLPWPEAFARFEQRRRPNCEAIATMALENYVEMRSSVRSAEFLARQRIARELARQHPQRFIPRYSMVMFHAQIPYAEALRRGAIQQQIIERLDQQRVAGEIDSRLAESLIAQSLPPIGAPES